MCAFKVKSFFLNMCYQIYILSVILPLFAIRAYTFFLYLFSITVDDISSEAWSNTLNCCNKTSVSEASHVRDIFLLLREE